jgi:molecular chaperone GrpE
MPNSPASEDEGRAVEERDPEAQAPQGEDSPDDGRDMAAELAEMEDRWKRALADMENYRKRSTRDMDRRLVEGREALLREWLEAVDSVDRALRTEEPGSPVFEGLRAVLEQMEAILARQGVTRIGSVGEPFDPERHEAIGVQATAEAPDRTVVEVARSGFAIGDRVLRPAQVIVARREEGED